MDPLYGRVKVSKEQPGRVVCIVPNLDGRTLEFVNHQGNDVNDRRRNVSNYLELEQVLQSASDEIQYQLSIKWTGDQYIQEQLKVLQCIANFQGSTHPCKTSVVLVNFEVSSNPGMLKSVTMLSAIIINQQNQVSALPCTVRLIP